MNKQLRAEIAEVRSTLAVVVQSLQDLHFKVNRLVEDGCKLRRVKTGTGPHLPSLFKEDCGDES